MHRTIEITIPSDHTDKLIDDPKPLPDVLGLSVQRGASIKPAGDILTVQSLNRGADEVLRRVHKVQQQDVPVSVATSELTSVIDSAHQRQIKNDIDEEIWEEMETSLRHQCHITSNFLLLMGLGRAIASSESAARGRAGRSPLNYNAETPALVTETTSSPFPRP